MNKGNDIIFDIALDVLKDQPVLQTWTFTDSELTKFAKMVVRECISTIENAENGYYDYRDQIENAMRDHCIWLIHQKFGVET